VVNIYGYEYYSLSDWQTARGEDLSSIAANPRFVRPTAYDFSLLNGSPAINAGRTLTGVVEDFDGTERPQDAAFDIGAFECPAGTGCGLLFLDGFESGNLAAW
jgi:hypothetical protein